MLLTKETLVVPDVEGTNGTTYDMKMIYEAEARISEISLINTIKAPELVQTFSKACFTLGEYLAKCQLALALCERKLNKRKAVLVLDVVPHTIKSKGLSQNETTRSAIIDLDEQYNDILEKKETLEAAYVLLKEKLRAFEGAMSSIRRLLDDSSGVKRRANPNLTSDYSGSTADLDEDVAQFFGK